MIELQLLGAARLDAPQLSANARARRRHPLALLGLVAASWPQPVPREKLVAYLWPESDAERASNSLRQALFWLRRELGDDVFLPESAGGVQLDTRVMRVDLCCFREALERGDPAAAIAHYGGPFLDGFALPGALELSQWIDGERDRLARQYLGALDEVARRAEAEGDFDQAVSWRRRLAAADPYSSRVALALLRALVAAGDRTGALEYARVYESMTRVQLEIDPDPQVMEYVASLRAGTVVHTPRRQPEVAVPEAAVPEPGTEGDVFAADPPRHSGVRRWSVRAAALLGFALLGGRSLIGAVSPGSTLPLVVLGSGIEQIDGRDPRNLLIACAGPACPPGALPQPAFVVRKHESYVNAVAGTHYIAPAADGTSASAPGYRCCTTARFESTFELPHDAVSARITISVAGDNQVIVAVNGQEIGRQQDRFGTANYTTPATFAAEFEPAAHGTNRLQVTLWDGGGALGLQYHATVTYELPDAGTKKPAPESPTIAQR